VSSGWNHTCAIKQSGGTQGTLWCWGGAGRGETGLTIPSDSPQQLGSATNWVAVASGFDHSCAVQDLGATTATYCWGTNDLGQLGTGDAWDPTP
jgi:alpha-tubulin suppressor-like RCC1 family protein